MRSLGLSLTLLVAVLHCMHAARTIPKHSIDIVSNTHTHKRRGGDDVPGTIKPTYAGYLKVSPDGSAIYYAYYEAQTQGKSEDAGDAPIVLWLQGGPGCASTFGGFYELGPWSVREDLSVEPNPGSWNRLFGLLLLDQPVGTGYSLAANGSSSVPPDEIGMATHLYTALQGFFTSHKSLADRPFFITGESYAGKYVPSIAHYILQVGEEAGQHQHQQGQQQPGSKGPLLSRRRSLPLGQSAPVFKLAGRGGGAGSWAGGFITNATGIATMFDTRRTEMYDPSRAVDRLLNLPEVKEAMRARPDSNYTSCSQLVGGVMAADTMQSVKALLPDILRRLPVLLYQGQYDILDGVASVTSWTDALEWEHQAAGWRRSAGPLTHVVVYRAGHMVPHDQPAAALQMMEGWVMAALEGAKFS
eukprot:XP_001689421.1 serine carboxypeptidase [Chlamydomonas reinhardtii]